MIHLICHIILTRHTAHGRRPGVLWGLLGSQTLLSNGVSTGVWCTLQHFTHHRIIYSIMGPFSLYIMWEHKLWPVCPQLSRRQTKQGVILAKRGGFCRAQVGGGRPSILGHKTRRDQGLLLRTAH